MGRDKGLVLFLGQPLIERVLHRVAGLADDVLVTTNQPESYRFLHVRLVEDLLPGRGALGGLYTALSAAEGDAVAIVACDMPFVSPELLVAERDRLFESGAQAVIPSTAEGLEPFHGVYRRAACLPLVKAALEAGLHRADAWFSQAKIQTLTPEEILRHDPTGLAFWNLNTPLELAQAEEMVRNSLSK